MNSGVSLAVLFALNVVSEGRCQFGIHHFTAYHCTSNIFGCWTDLIWHVASGALSMLDCSRNIDEYE